jgi:hypothetical protein
MDTNVSNDILKLIVEQGNDAWERFMEEAHENNKFPDGIPPANAMAKNFDVYKGKYMPFKDIDFNKTITDKNGKRYFASENPKFKGFILQFSTELHKKMVQYSALLGKIGSDDWEIIGEVYDVYSWWFNFVYVKLVGLRVKDKFTAFFIENDDDAKVEFVGEDLLIEELTKLENSASEVPSGLTEIPAQTDPLIISKLLYQLSIVEDNFDLWSQLFTVENQRRASMLKSIYNGLRKNESVYFHVSTAIDEEEKKKYFFQLKMDGEFTGSPKPINLVKEKDEWRVSSASI